MTRATPGIAIALLALAAAGCRGPGTAADPDAPPDVVVVMIDALRADHVGAYGYGGGTTEHLDALAAGGALFADARANCSWTRPSMASALTGLWPRQTGVHDERSYDRLPDDLVLLSERFADAGYATAGVTANPNLDAVFGFDQGFDRYVESAAVWSWMRTDDAEPQPLLDADAVTDAALVLAREADGPLYLQAVYLEPHTPLHPPRRYERRFARGELDDQERELALYDAEIAFADDQIRRLLRGLARQGRADPIVVVFGDHGEGFFDHPDVPFTREHGYVLYDSNLLVPWLVRHSSIPAGTVVVDPVELLDLTPTVLALAGLEVPDELAGRSHAGALRGGPSSPAPDAIFAETARAHTDKTAIVAGDRKLIRNHDHAQLTAAGLDAAVRRHLTVAGAVERYDLAALARDGVAERPRETQAGPDTTFAGLERQLAAWERDHPRRDAERPADDELDPALLQQLRALGYLE